MAYFERDSKPYCEADFSRLFCEKCPACDEYVLVDGVMALNKTWHAEVRQRHPLLCGVCWFQSPFVFLSSRRSQQHLVCKHCSARLEESAHEGDDGNVYCKEHFLQLFAEACGSCGKPIEGEAIDALDKRYHADCFVCSHCSEPLTDTFRPHDGHPYCEAHYLELFGADCYKCGLKVSPSTQLQLLDKVWHAECLVCHGPCGRQLDTSVKIFPKGGEPWCEACFLGAATKCADCGEAVIGAFLSVLDRKYHKECLKCFSCSKLLDGKLFNRLGWPVCAHCTRGPLSDAAKARIAAEKEQNGESSDGGDGAAVPAASPAPPPPAPPAADSAGAGSG